MADRIEPEVVRVIDPDNVREVFVTGACNVGRVGSYVKILLTVVRDDPEALMANGAQRPDLVVVSRILMEADTARGLAQSILIQLGEGGAPIPDFTRN